MEMDLAEEECALYPLSHSETDEESEPEDTPMPPPHATPSPTRLIELWRQNGGAVLVLLSMFFAASMNACVRILETEPGTPLHAIQIVFVLQVSTLAGILLYGYMLAPKLTPIPSFPLGPRNVRVLLIIRGIADSVALFGILFSLQYLWLVEATVLTFLSPVLTCGANAGLLGGERFTLLQMLASAVTLIGVALVTMSSLNRVSAPMASAWRYDKPQNVTISAHGLAVMNKIDAGSTSSSAAHLVAVVVALLGVLGQAGGLVAIRRLGPRIPTLVGVAYSAAVCSVLSALALLAVPGTRGLPAPSGRQLALLIAAALCGFIYQLLLPEGLAFGAQTGPDSTGSARQSKPEESGLAPSSSAVTHNQDEKMVRTRSKGRHTPRGANQRMGMMYTQLLFALVYDFAIWGTVLSWQSWAGILFTAVGAVWVVMTKHY